jgi:hypothetical protein
MAIPAFLLSEFSLTPAGTKNTRHVNLTHKEQARMSTFSVGDLIRLSKEAPPEPVIEQLLHVRDIMVMHGTEECFKSVLIFQMAESIARGVPLLGSWGVPQKRRVGIIETEMHPSQIGARLALMFAGATPPNNIRIVGEDTLHIFRRALT